MSHLEQKFADLWLSLYPAIDLHSEYRFSPPRRYRWDFCHPSSKVAIEIQGGVWMGKSGHSGGSGLLKDYQKLCLAASQGWRVFLLADSMITDEYLGSIATAISTSELTATSDTNQIGVHIPQTGKSSHSKELTAIPNQKQIAVNSPIPARAVRQQDYIGCISPKQIKGITYHYWVYYERGKRCYRCMGTDRSSAVAKAKAIYDPRTSSRSMIVN